MKKTIFFALAAFSGLASLSQQKQKEPPPPPAPPKVNIEKFAPPPPPKEPGKLPFSSQGADYKKFLKRNPSVKSVGWTSEDGINVYLKSGAVEKYDLKNDNDLRTFNNKYGELPIAPPQPPKPKVQKFAPPVIKAE